MTVPARLLLIFVFWGIATAPVQSAGFAPEKAAHGMVVTADAYATEAGLEILQQGGNAVDAAVAVGFTLAVTYPNAGNIGGGGFMMIGTADGRVRALDYRETAPGAATRDMYLDESGRVIKNASVYGLLACGVPGTVAGMWQAHQKFGKLPWKNVLAPAIRLAEKGFPLDEYKTELFNAFRDSLSHFPSSKKIFFPQNRDYKPGDIFRQPQLAQTLRRIAQQGGSEFYFGKTAQMIDRFMKANGGLITLNDLKNYRAKWRQPIHFTYRGYDVYSMPPPSSGGVLLAEILNTLENFNLRRMGVNSSSFMRLWVETERQAYADRAYFLGDPDFVRMPITRLTSKTYAQKIKNSLHLLYPAVSDSIHPGLAYGKEKEETTHFSIVDQWGNAVSNTFTLNGNFGSFVVVKDAGFLLNNEMDDFSVKPGIPNIYGLIGGKANEIQPGKRMLSSMTPTLIFKNKRLFMAIGSPGGSKIITTVAQVISHVIDHSMNIRQAIEMPRFHHQWRPDTVFVEQNRFNEDTIHILQAAGYRIVQKKYMGYAQGILMDQNGMRTGWSDPRSNGVAKGY